MRTNGFGVRAGRVTFAALWIMALAPVAGPALGRDLQSEVNASPGERLVLDLEAGGDVEIIGWSRDTVRVTGDVEGPDPEGVALDVRRKSYGVLVHTRREGNSRNQRSKVSLTIHVPDRYDVDIDSMGGSIRIEGLEGTLEGETMGGNLDLRGLTGDVDLVTMGGNVTLRDSDVDGRVRTMGGRVLIEDVVGDVDGSSMGGQVVIKNLRHRDGGSTGETVKISTMGGDIDVEEAPAGADVSTMGGDIHVRRARDFVRAKTMGGDLRIDEADGRVDATTMAGDVDVEIVGDGGDVELRSFSGEIHLIVPRGLDMEIDIELAYTKGSSRNYRIISDFPLEERRTTEWEYDDGSPRKFIFGTGKVGSGKHRIKIRTINGDVHLKSGG